MPTTLAAPPRPATRPAAEPTAPTPDGPAAARDGLYDLLRVVALGVVVVWHWVFTTMEINSDGLHTGNPVGVTPGMWLATWFLQPMPYFFMVGGALHAATYKGRPTQFWSRRFKRLVLPALPLVIPALALIAWGMTSGHATLASAVFLMITPMWFLVVYLVLILIAPLALRAHRARPLASLLVLIAGAALVDVARFSFGWSNWVQIAVGFLVVWAAVHQLGFWFDHLRQAQMATRVFIAAVGFLGLLGLHAVGPYPLAMVGVPGEQISNMGPPNLMVVFLALFQIGLITMVAEPLARYARRHARGLAVASDWSMTVFVWHLVAWTAFFVVVTQVWHLLTNDTVTATWWLQRPIWFVGPALVAIPLVKATKRFS